MIASIASLAVVGLAGFAQALPAATSTTSSASSGQTPFKFPLANGFPDITIPSDALKKIEVAAHGTLPDGALPTSLAAEDIADFQLIALNELFEVAFFTSLLKNVTEKVDGYELYDSEEIVTALKAIRAQEELHALGANAIVKSAGGKEIKPCEYVFPTANFLDAVAFASEFTDVVLGALGNVQYDLGTNGDSELIPLLAAVIGQEGEQDGYYREIGQKVPSALPFLTAGSGLFAYNVLMQNVIVNGSCPNADLIGLSVLPALTLETSPVAAKTQTLSFEFENTTGKSASDLHLVYVNQQNTPIVESLSSTSTSGKMVSFSAKFPYEKTLMNGLTYAVLTDSAGPFSDAYAVANSTVAGPALIEIN